MPRPTPLLIATAPLFPGAAFAHAGIGAHGGSPFAAGLLHPFLGADHLLAMVAVGLFAAMIGGRALWAHPGGFVAAMILGGFLGFEGARLPIIEPTILASVVVLGAAIAFAIRPPLLVACGVIALFGVAHGYAHGLEAPEFGGWTYAAGFVLATAILHGIGLALGFLGGSLGRPTLARGIGALACVGGFAMMLN